MIAFKQRDIGCSNVPVFPSALQPLLNATENETHSHNLLQRDYELFLRIFQE